MADVTELQVQGHLHTPDSYGTRTLLGCLCPGFSQGHDGLEKLQWLLGGPAILAPGWTHMPCAPAMRRQEGRGLGRGLPYRESGDGVWQEEGSLVT